MKHFYFIIVCLFSLIGQAQNILIVDNNSGINTTPAHVFPDFTSAITAAVNGDIIYVQPSATSYGSITINKEVTVYGNGHFPELDNGINASFIGIGIAADNVKVSGVNITSGISTSGSRANVIIENCLVPTINLSSGINECIIQGNIITSQVTLNANSLLAVNVTFRNNFCQFQISSDFENFNSSTIFTNNIITNRTTHQSSLFDKANGLVVQNSIFVFNNGLAYVGNLNGTPITFNNCVTYNYTGVTISALNGTNNNDNINPQFVTIPTNTPLFSVANNYNINPTLLGTDGFPIGIHNGGYDFDMRGYPTPLAYISEMNINNNIITAGANLNITLKANANKSN